MFFLSERDSLSWSYYFEGRNFGGLEKGEGHNGLANAKKCS